MEKGEVKVSAREIDGRFGPSIQLGSIDYLIRIHQQKKELSAR